MTLSPGLRKLALTAHITCSVGWLGAVFAFLALSVVGLTSQNIQLVRAVYLVAEPLTLFVILPLALASLVSGLVQAFGTPWGLLRHYWVLIKFALTVLAVLVLLSYVQTVTFYAGVARDPAAGLNELRSPSFILHSGLALLVLLATAALSVYKPKGMTPYGQRRAHADTA